MRILLTIFVLFTAISVKADIDPAFQKMCAAASTFQSLASSVPNFQIETTALPPYTGIVVGLISKENPLLSVCELVNTLTTSEGMSKIFAVKSFLNTMTDNKFSEDSVIFDKTFNILNSRYDLTTGKNRPGDMKSASSIREMNDYMKDLNVYIAHKQMSEADKKAADQNYVTESQQFAKIASENANIKAALHCPEPGDTDYSGIYTKQIAPQEKIRDDATEDEQFFRSQLLRLGQAMFQGDLGGYASFADNLKNIREWGINMNMTDTKYTETTYTPSQVELDADGHPVMVNKSVVKMYQNYKTEIHQDAFDRFKNEFSAKWSKYVKIMYLTKTTQYGLFAGAGKRVEKEFRDVSYECRERIVMQGYSVTNSDYNTVLEKKQKECKEDLQMDEKKADNLFEFYMTNFQNSLYKLRNTTAAIWTFESRYLKINHQISDSNSFTEDNVSCSKVLTPTEMKQLKQQQISSNNDMKEMISKNYQERNATTKEQMANKAKSDSDDELAMQKVETDKKERHNELLNGGSTITPHYGGINAGKKE